MKLDFGEVLGRMWKIGWNHKVLWLWQMLPGLFMTIFMPFAIVLNPAFAMSLPEPWNQYANEEWALIAFVAAMFILVIPIMLIGVIAQMATIYGASKVDKGAEKLAFLELFHESLPFFWRMLGLHAIFGGAWMVIWFGFMAIFMFGSILTFGLAPICVMPLFLLLMPVLLVGASVMQLGQVGIIADDMGTLDAISHGWKLFRTNWLGVGLFMIILHFSISTLSSVIMFPITFPMIFLPVWSLEAEDSFIRFMPVLLIVIFPLMLFFTYIVQGILMAFFQTAWTVAYARLSDADMPTLLMESALEAGT